MTKGYWVALVDVSDPDGYKAYMAENPTALRKFGGCFLARGGKSETPEGQTRSRVVVIEFPNYAVALECYRSPEYAKAMDVNAGARLHRFPEQRCINNADENALEHGLASWASGWGQIVFGRVGVVAA